jgi:hypothetical protein
MLKTTYVGEQLLHRLLWHIVEEESERATKLERGWFNPTLVAMIFAFHTVEAYLNYVGERLAPEIWQDERNFFKKEPYRGFDGKLRKVRELVDLSGEESHLKTVIELKELRDLIAHGKPEKFSREIVHSVEIEPPALASRIHQMVSPKGKLDETMRDVERCLCEIHSLAKSKLKVYDVWFGDHPLKGTSQWTLHSTTTHSG